MIYTIKKDISDISAHPQTGYFITSESALRHLLIEDHCGGKTSRRS